MGELSFLTIIVSLAVCSILVYAVYQYMKVRFTVLENSQKEQALILQQYIEESSYDIQGLQDVVFKQAQAQAPAHHHHHPLHGFNIVSEQEDSNNDDHNKHIHMDTVMYEAPNKQRNTLIAISSDSEDTTSDESDSESESESDSESDSESESDSDHENESACIVNDIHDIKHIEITLPNNTELGIEIESVDMSEAVDMVAQQQPSDNTEAPVEAPVETKKITIDLGASVDISSGPDTINVLSLLNKTAEQLLDDEDGLVEEVQQDEPSFVVPSTGPAFTHSYISGLSVIELRALLKEKYKGQHDKITNLQKLKKPELVQLLQE